MGHELQTPTCSLMAPRGDQPPATRKADTVHRNMYILNSPLNNLYRLHACAQTVLRNPTSDTDSKFSLIKTFRMEV